MKKSGFSLAEILIVFAILGVIAAIVITNIQNSVLDNARNKQTLIAKHKFAKAIENMALNYDMGAYYGTGDDKRNATAEFADRLKKYYRINKICSSVSLEDCWGYSKIKFANGNSYEINQAINGKLFKIGGNESLSDDYDVDTAGVLATDGTRYIMAFNKNCKSIDPAVYAWTDDGTNNTAMGCISAIMDIDGNKAPNTIGKDISFINATGIGKNCMVEIGDACFGALFYPTPIKVTTDGECREIKELGITTCLYNKNDYFAGGVVACGGIDKLPERNDFLEIFPTATSSYKQKDVIKYGLPDPGNNRIRIMTNRGETINSGKESYYAIEYFNNINSNMGSHSWAVISREAVNSYVMCKLD